MKQCLFQQPLCFNLAYLQQMICRLILNVKCWSILTHNYNCGFLSVVYSLAWMLSQAPWI